jgi:UPF0042 nucleotide-binding protein
VGDRPRLVVITGMAGAGRSTASKALEDIGFFVIDNLPARLIGDVVEPVEAPEDPRDRLAVAIDTRGGLSFHDLEAELATLRQHGIDTSVLFLDAEDDVLVKRFKESRRPHPVEGPTLVESIASERRALQALRDRADIVVDTSGRSVHDLREIVQEAFLGERPRPPMRVSVSSFGFKHGVPNTADVVFDVRFLPNPYWEPHLRDLTGLDGPVRDFVMQNEDTGAFLEQVQSLLLFLLPRFEAEGKAYLSVAVGCTGGHHRSVALAEALGVWLKDRDVPATIDHRDVRR